MILFRHVIALGCLFASLIAPGAEQPALEAKVAADQPATPELRSLQGRWSGVMVGHENTGAITVTIIGHTLHFHRDTNFWFATTFKLPAGTDPQQLQSTIKECPRGQESSVGKVVEAIFKIEDETLTLVAVGGGDDETPRNFEAAEEKGWSRSELKKDRPPTKKSEPAQTN